MPATSKPADAYAGSAIKAHGAGQYLPHQPQQRTIFLFLPTQTRHGFDRAYISSVSPSTLRAGWQCKMHTSQSRPTRGNNDPTLASWFLLAPACYESGAPARLKRYRQSKLREPWETMANLAPGIVFLTASEGGDVRSYSRGGSDRPPKIGFDPESDGCDGSDP